MKVFKFGGASVKDAPAIKNVSKIVRLFPGQDLFIVVSAIGKTTNQLEEVVDTCFKNKEDSLQKLERIKDKHLQLAKELLGDQASALEEDLHNFMVGIEWELEDTEEGISYDQKYDQIVSAGELLSTKIVSAYLNHAGLQNYWLDVRDVIKTDDTWREGKIDWNQTETLIQNKINQLKKDGHQIIITQGFLGCTSENYTTTLGREGSDYTAAVFAYCTNSESVTIWKDVPGVLNADPKWFDNTFLLEQLSYQDTIELAYYGATVIHPKTIKPLQNKNIPLYVKSFVDPEKPGTVINSEATQKKAPCFIFKVHQLLISISPKDFSFIVEENFSDIFKLFSAYGVKINTMLNSAISFSVCVDHIPAKTNVLMDALKKDYRVKYNENVELITIRYYDQATIDRVMTDKELLLEVKSRYTVQLVVKALQ